jgi:hypothetical protein
MTPDWIRNEILDGLTRLLSLSLARQPATDLIEITAQNWIVAFTANRVLERDLDAPRIRRAFDTLVSERVEWPAPRHFVEAFNATTRAQAALTKQHIPANPQRVAVVFAEIAGMFGSDAHCGKVAAAGPDA